MFHAILPLLAYLLLAMAGFAIFVQMRDALFAVGAAILLLLFVGIHNTRDAILCHVFANVMPSDSDLPSQARWARPA
jgi:hypothetical protein